MKVIKLEKKGIEFESDSEVMRVVLPHVIGIGYSLAFIVFIFEIVWHRITIYNDIYDIIFDDFANYYSCRNFLELLKFVLNLRGLRKIVIKVMKQCVKFAKFCCFKIKPSRMFKK